MPNKINIFGDLPKKPIKQMLEDNRLVERVENENLYPFKRGSFETYEDYKKRLNNSFQYDISIGTIKLHDFQYNIENKNWRLWKIELLKWFENISDFETTYVVKYKYQDEDEDREYKSDRFYIKIEPQEAKSLFYDYKSYELVAQFEIDKVYGITVNMDYKVRVVITKMWLVAIAKNESNSKGLKLPIKDLKEEEYFKYDGVAQKISSLVPYKFGTDANDTSFQPYFDTPCIDESNISILDTDYSKNTLCNDFEKFINIKKNKKDEMKHLKKEMGKKLEIKKQELKEKTKKNRDKDLKKLATKRKKKRKFLYIILTCIISILSVLIFIYGYNEVIEVIKVIIKIAITFVGMLISLFIFIWLISP